jgi:glycosyltransferase involved in cell wall biosynthesis
MRILITSVVDLKKTPHNRLHQFIRYLSPSHEITVLSINDWWKASQADATQYIKGLEGGLDKVDVRYFTSRRISPILQELTSITILDRLLNDVDYGAFDVHLNYNSLIAGYFVARRMRAVGVATVYDIADDLAEMVRHSPQIPPPFQPLAGLVARIMVRQNVNVSKRIVFITGRLTASCAIPMHKAVLIPNGADTDLFCKLSGNGMRATLGLGDSFVLGYVGVLREWVNLEPVFAAVSELGRQYHDLKVLIVGEEGQLAENQKLVERHGIAQNVLFSGTVPWVELPQYIACMNVCLLPFRPGPISEGSLPLKLFEYMACEKPVVATPLNGITEAVDRQVLYASNSQEYKEAIIRLRQDHILAEELGKNGRALVKTNFTWSSSAARLEAVLEEVSRR